MCRLGLCRSRMVGLDEQIARRNELAGLVKKMQTEQKAIEKEQPEIYRDYTKVQKSSRLNIQAA